MCIRDRPDSKDEDRTLLDTLESSESNVEEGQIRMAAREEIEEYARGLAEFGISLTDVADNCPKQDRTCLLYKYISSISTPMVHPADETAMTF